MTPVQIGVAVRRFPWFLLGGSTVFALGLFIGEGCVTMTGLLGVMLGACVVGFGQGMLYRGMWFFAVLIWVGTAFIYAVMSYLHFWHLFAHPCDVVRLVSLAAATWMLGIQTRFLLTVATVNWRLSRNRLSSG